MITRKEVLAFGLNFPDTYEEMPFHDGNWQLVRVYGIKKAFLWIYERNGYINLNLKVDTENRDFWRSVYPAVTPAWHQNKEHWNTVILDGSIPDDIIKEMITHSYRLVTDSPTRRIYDAVKAIPFGKVATYGQIAKAAGESKMARAVGNALRKAPEQMNLPWHRVINSKGELTRDLTFDGYETQAKLLENEGIHVNGNLVDLKKYQMKDPAGLFIHSCIDLHLHLDGAITVDIAKRLAKLQNIKLPAESEEELFELLSVPYGCRNLNEFLDRFTLPISLLQTKEAISEAVYLVQEMIKEQHVIYAEIRFAPKSFTQKGLSQREVIEAALEGLKRSELRCNLILCCMRGNSYEDNMETILLAEEYLVSHNGIVAVDLAGAEALFPTSYYKELFEAAAQKGIPFTLHAGEADGPESVKAAIKMGASRIGHGVRAMEDPEVVNLLAKHQIPVEMCPISNIHTCAIEDMTKYPLTDYLACGIPVTLNTDDMGISNTNILQQYDYMRNQFGITSAQCQTMLENSVKYAFTDEPTRQWLYEMISFNDWKDYD